MDGYALVFGAGSGIGRETAWLFAEKGASGVAFADLNIEAAQAAANESKKYASNTSYKVLALQVDVVDNEAVLGAVQKTKTEFGHIDFAVNSAGIAGVAIEGTEQAKVQACFQVNAQGVKHCIDAEAGVMKNQEVKYVQGRNGSRPVGRGAIVSVLSINGMVPVPGNGAYGASKVAGITFSNVAACEHARFGVRINSVLPSYTQTNMYDAICEAHQGVDEFAKKVIPTSRVAVAEEVAEVIHFLCGPGASYMQGSNVIVDSGVTITRGLL